MPNENEETIEETPNIETNNNEREETIMRKIDRTEWVDFLNVSSTSTPDWAIIGVGITDKSTDYNANVTEEKWIIHKNANKTIDNYALQSGVEQTAYKDDPVFEFVDNIRYRLLTGSDAETDLLEIDKYSVTGTEQAPTYRARKWRVAIEISSNAGDSAKVNYNYHYIGDPEFGTVAFDSNGKPTFTQES